MPGEKVAARQGRIGKIVFDGPPGVKPREFDEP
jgi:hypothetical protein